jgi:hypothetical protein
MMADSKLKIFSLTILFFAVLSCTKRQESATTIISTTKPEAPSTTIFSNEPPSQGGTVIMATAPGATPAPATPAPGPTIPPPSAVIPSAPSAVTGAVLSAAVPVAPPPAPPTAVEVSTLSTTEKVGLLECDTFVDRYVSCINRNVPADRQAPLIRGLESNIRRWQSMMSTAAGRTDAGNDCQRAFDQTRQAMTPYSCTWE